VERAPTKTEAPARANEPEPESEVDPETRARLRAAVRSGREAFRAERFAEAAGHFDRALEIEGRSARLRCEAGFVHFRAQHLDVAERLIGQALAAMPPAESAPEPVRRELAMCLYNAGLVYEARARIEDARAAWTSSLALRPNATVEQRLAALDAPREEQPRPALALDASAGFDAMARVLRDRFCEEGGVGFTRADLESCDAIGVRLREPTGTAEGIEARIVDLNHTQLSVDERTALIVRAGDRARAYLLGEVFMPGAGGVSAETEIASFAFADLVPGGMPEIRIDLTSYENDEDMGVCERNGSSGADTIVCTADPEIACARFPTARDSYFEYDGGCGDPRDEDGDGDYSEARANDEPVERHQRYRLELAFAEGNATARVLEQADREPPSALVGTHPVAALLGEAELALAPW
jgi:hypothetical protein